MSRDWPKEVVGSGVWVARDGLERRRTLRERECGLVDWVLDWAMVGRNGFFARRYVDQVLLF
jgi:hypothetical protein